MSAAKKYRKKPVVIEAMRVPAPVDFYFEREYLDAMRTAAEWCDGTVTVDGGRWSGGHMVRVIDISTLEGVMRAQPGDQIIRGVQGEFYPCKPDIFADTYEAVTDRPNTDGTT